MAEMLTSEVKLPYSRRLAYGITVAGLCLAVACCSGKDDGPNPPPANKPPVVSAVFNPVSLPEDTSTSVPVAGHFYDSDKGDTLSYSVSGCSLATLNGSQINITPAPDYNGSQTCTVKACDPHNACVTTTLGVTVTPVNDGPVVDLIEITTANELYPLAGYVTFHDIDSSTITCSKVSSTLPQLLVATDGTISSTGNLDRDIAGNYSVTVSCSDGFLNGTKTTTFDVRDVTNPGRITDLIPTATIGNVEQIELNWTGTGDDGAQGKPQKYLVRFSDTEIVTVQQWDAAAALPDVVAQWDSGVWYSQLFANIPPGHFCFAVRAVDEVNNIGEVSNSPCADVISRAEWFVDSYLPTGRIYLDYDEVVSMMQGATVMEGSIVHSIPSRALDVGTILATVTAPPYDTPAAMEAYLKLVTDGSYNPGGNDYELCSKALGGMIQSALYWENINIPHSLTLPTRAPPTDCSPGVPDTYSPLADQNMTDLRNIFREHLILWVDANKAQYCNLTTPCAEGEEWNINH